MTAREIRCQYCGQPCITWAALQRHEAEDRTKLTQKEARAEKDRIYKASHRDIINARDRARYAARKQRVVSQ